MKHTDTVNSCQDCTSYVSVCQDSSFSLQTISLLVYMSGALGKKGPFLVLSPLSVMENWRRELEGYSHIHIRIYIHSLQSWHHPSQTVRYIYKILSLCFAASPRLWLCCATKETKRGELSSRGKQTHRTFMCYSQHMRSVATSWEQNDLKVHLCWNWRVFFLFLHLQLCLKDASFLRRWVAYVTAVYTV